MFMNTEALKVPESGTPQLPKFVLHPSVLSDKCPYTVSYDPEAWVEVLKFAGVPDSDLGKVTIEFKRRSRSKLDREVIEGTYDPMVRKNNKITIFTDPSWKNSDTEGDYIDEEVKRIMADSSRRYMQKQLTSIAVRESRHMADRVNKTDAYIESRRNNRLAVAGGLTVWASLIVAAQIFNMPLLDFLDVVAPTLVMNKARDILSKNDPMEVSARTMDEMLRESGKEFPVVTLTPKVNFQTKKEIEKQKKAKPPEVIATKVAPQIMQVLRHRMEGVDKRNLPWVEFVISNSEKILGKTPGSYTYVERLFEDQKSLQQQKEWYLNAWTMSDSRVPDLVAGIDAQLAGKRSKTTDLSVYSANKGVIKINCKRFEDNSPARLSVQVGAVTIEMEECDNGQWTVIRKEKGYKRVSDSEVEEVLMSAMQVVKGMEKRLDKAVMKEIAKLTDEKDIDDRYVRRGHKSDQQK